MENKMWLRKRDSRRDEFKMKNLTGWKVDCEMRLHDAASGRFLDSDDLLSPFHASEMC
jgi:hypothetical protein